MWNLGRYLFSRSDASVSTLSAGLYDFPFPLRSNQMRIISKNASIFAKQSKCLSYCDCRVEVLRDIPTLLIISNTLCTAVRRLVVFLLWVE